MKVKPLSEDELYTDDLMCGDSEGPYYQAERLKELFAELKKRGQPVNQMPYENHADRVSWDDIEELFGPLMPK